MSNTTSQMLSNHRTESVSDVRAPKLNRRMVRKVVGPEGPELFANLPCGRIAVLVQRFEEPKDTQQPIPTDSERIRIHRFIHLSNSIHRAFESQYRPS